MRGRGPVLAVVLVGCVAEADLAVPVADAGPDVDGYVGEVVRLDGSASEGVQVRWGTGDGTLLDGAVVQHTYVTPGVYSATIEVLGEDGTRRTDAARVLITHRPAEVPPTRSAPLVLDGAGVPWVVFPEAGGIVGLADPAAPTWVPVCDDPRSLAAGAQGIAVACAGDDRVVMVDPAEGSVLASHSLPAGSRPVAVAWRPRRSDPGDTFVVGLAGLHALVDVGEGGAGMLREGFDDVRALAVLPDDTVLASRWRGRDDTSLVHVEGEPPIVLAYDPGPDTDTGHRGVPHLVGRIGVSPDGRTAWLPGVQANTARGPHRDGRPLTFETTVRAHLSVVDVQERVERPGRRKVFDDQGRALAIAVSPRGDRVWVSHPGTGVIHAVDAFDGAIRGSILGAGRGLIGLALTPDGDTLIAWAWLDRAVHAYDVTVDPPVRTWTADLAPLDPVDPTVLRGQRLFWEAGDPRLGRAGYLACAHCHPDGDQDGLVWDFGARGEGLRNTTSLLGRAGTAMGPLHWSGNFDEVQDFEHDLRGPNNGRGLLDDAVFATVDAPLGGPKAGLDADLDALAAYVASLDATPTSPHPPGDREALARAGCTACHVPPLYTDSSLETFVRHDVGTLTPASGGRLGGPLDGLDTPTLLGAFDTPPWLHDGSAGTLAEAIAAHDGLDLTAEEIRRLAEAVRGL